MIVNIGGDGAYERLCHEIARVLHLDGYATLNAPSSGSKLKNAGVLEVKRNTRLGELKKRVVVRA